MFMVLILSVMVQGGNEVLCFVEEVCQVFFFVEQNGVSLKQRVGFYQVVRVWVKLFEKFVGQDNIGLVELWDGVCFEFMWFMDDGLSYDIFSFFFL